MKRRLIFILIPLVLPMLVNAQALTKIKATGMGNSENQALDLAKRNAVEQGVGSVVASETITNNYQLASDRIFSRANGFVKNYTILSRVQNDEGWRVEIEAEVTDIFDELMKDQIAIDLLLQWMEKPRFMMLLNEDNLSERSTACETELGRKLIEKHFDLVSRLQVDAVRERQTAKAALDGDLRAAAKIASDFGAEILVIGNAVTSIAPGVDVLEEAGMKSVQANFSAQIISAGDARILASYTAQHSAVHVNPASAGVQALTCAAASMADSLVGYLLKVGSEAQLAVRSISLTIQGVGFSEFRELKEVLRSIEGVSAVYQRSFSAPVAEIAVEYSGRAMDLAVEIDGFKIGESELQVNEVTGNTISLKLIK